MRAEPMKSLGLNVAISFVVRSGFRCSGFRFHLACAADLFRGTHLYAFLAFRAARHNLLGPIP
jgi:hypothetical protein